MRNMNGSDMVGWPNGSLFFAFDHFDHPSQHRGSSQYQVQSVGEKLVVSAVGTLPAADAEEKPWGESTSSIFSVPKPHKISPTKYWSKSWLRRESSLESEALPARNCWSSVFLHGSVDDQTCSLLKYALAILSSFLTSEIDGNCLRNAVEICGALIHWVVKKDRAWCGHSELHGSRAQTNVHTPCHSEDVADVDRWWGRFRRPCLFWRQI